MEGDVALFFSYRANQVKRAWGREGDMLLVNGKASRLLRAVGLAVLVALPCASSATTTWFVNARHGSNGFSGLSSFAPKRTIQAAINAASAGDCVIVAGGTSGFYRIKVGK